MKTSTIILAGLCQTEACVRGYDNTRHGCEHVGVAEYQTGGGSACVASTRHRRAYAGVAVPDVEHTCLGMAVADGGVHPWVWQYQTEVYILGCGNTRQKSVSVCVEVPDRGVYPWVWQYQREVCIRGCGSTRQRCVVVYVVVPDRGVYPCVW